MLVLNIFYYNNKDMFTVFNTKHHVILYFYVSFLNPIYYKDVKKKKCAEMSHTFTMNDEQIKHSIFFGKYKTNMSSISLSLKNNMLLNLDSVM